MQKDFIIVLAWPEGMVAAPDSWYDKIAAKNGKYKTGHAALVLVNTQTNKLHYFDFGRYHSPLGFGRVRDAETDPDVALSTKAIIEDNSIKNIEVILNELVQLKASHGEGKLYASVLGKVSFEKGFLLAKQKQEKGVLPYGPFVKGGCNCSRFVASVIRVTNQKKVINLRLKYPFCISPSPKRNVSITNSNYYIVDSSKCEYINKHFMKAYFSSIERR